MTEVKSNTEQPITKTDGNLSYLQKRHRYIQPYQNLIIKRNTTNPNYQVDIDADYITIEGYKFDSIDLTVDITVSGEGGLDTGSESNDAHYYIWVIGNLSDTTASSLLSIQYPGSGTSPILPDGYTIKEFVGAVRNTGGNFIDFYLRDRVVSLPRLQALVDGTATTPTSLDLSQYIPINAKTVKVDLISTNGTAGRRGIQVSPDNTTDLDKVVQAQFYNTTGQSGAMNTNTSLQSTTIYYKNFFNSTHANIVIVGYTL